MGCAARDIGVLTDRVAFLISKISDRVPSMKTELTSLTSPSLRFVQS